MATHKADSHSSKTTSERHQKPDTKTVPGADTTDELLQQTVQQSQSQPVMMSQKQVMMLQRTIGNRAVNQLLRPAKPKMPAVLQRYVSFDPNVGGVPNVAGYNANSTFNAQQSAGGSFMDPATGAPRIVGSANGANTPVRISQNGDLAVEDANLSNRQPKYFFANPGLLAQWNELLQAAGSDFQLVQNGAETIQFTLNGHAKNLVRVDAQNLSNNTAGNQLLVAQECDQTIKSVIGSHGDPKAIFAQLPAIAFPNQPGYETVYEMMRQYYIADELVGGNTANAIDLRNSPNNLPNQEEQIAHDYGTAQFQDSSGAVPNPGMRQREQDLWIEENRCI
jgi:hypothetical protein